MKRIILIVGVLTAASFLAVASLPATRSRHTARAAIPAIPTSTPVEMGTMDRCVRDGFGRQQCEVWAEQVALYQERKKEPQEPWSYGVAAQRTRFHLAHQECLDAGKPEYSCIDYAEKKMKGN